MARKTVFILAAVILTFLLAGCSMDTPSKDQSALVQKYFGLVKKEKWNDKDKTEFISLFSVRGLNSVLAMYGHSSMEQFVNDPERRIGFYAGADLLVDQIKKFGKPQAGPDSGIAVRAVLVAGKKTKQYQMTRFYLVNNRIYDVQTRPAIIKNRLTIGSVLLGIYAILFLTTFFIGISNSKATKFKVNFLNIFILILLVGYIGNSLRAGLGFKGIFMKKSFQVIDGNNFADQHVPLERPYPGLPAAWIGSAFDAIVGTEANSYRSPKASQNSSDMIMAQSYHQMAKQGAQANDQENTFKLISSLHKSLSLAPNDTALAGLAYGFLSLYRLGINPELNLARARSLFAWLQAAHKDSSDALGLAVKALSVLTLPRGSQGKGGAALTSSIDKMLAEQLVRPGKVSKCTEWLLEANYFLKDSWIDRLQTANDLIRLDPNNPRYFNYKGVALFHTNDKNGALASFNRAAAMSKSYSDPARNILLMSEGGKPLIGVNNFGAPIVYNENSSFPFYSVWPFRDVAHSILAPQQGILDNGASKTTGVAAFAAIKAPFYKTGLAGRWNLRVPLWKKIVAITVFIIVGLFILLIISAIFASNSGMSGPARGFWVLLFGAAIYAVVWGIASWESAGLLCAWSYVAFFIGANSKKPG